MKITTGRISNQKHQPRFIFLALTLFLTLFYTTLIFGATFYVDPTFTGSVQNGTIGNPYSSWTQFTITNGNTYLQKRGTTFTTNGNLWINQKSNVTMGAYGTGSKPKFISTGNNVKVLDFANSTNCILRNFEVTSTGNALTAVYIASGCSNILIDSCVINNCEWGIRVVTNGGGTRILNSTIHNIGDDGIYVMYVPNIEIGYCHIYDVNMKWHTDPNQSYSPGDNIQISSTNNLYFHIHNNILDHSSTGNKFCFIAYGVNYSGLIEHNTMIGNAANVTSCLYFHPTTGTVTVRYNTLKDGNYAIYSYVNNLQLHYNKIINNKYGIRVLTNYNLTALNNVFYGNTEYCISSLGNTTITSRNNAFYLSSSAARVYNTGGSVVSNHNNFNIQQSNFINGHSTLASWRSASGNDINSFVSNPLFVNPAINDFCLQATSPCINSGTNVNLINDFFGTAVPQSSNPDIGIHEVISGGSSNSPPSISNQTFSIPENSANGTVVGQVIASDPDAGQTITYSITGGNTSNAFSINASNGLLTVANSQVLNYESIPSFQLIVRVTDNGTGNLWSQATVTVNLLNVNENPVIANQSFNVLQNALNGTIVGTVIATDPDLNQILSYSITSGNTNSAFAINSSTGRITVANSTAIVSGSFSLTVRVTDNGTPVLWSAATVTITVTGTANQAPVITNQSFSIAQNAPNGTLVGTVVATDPDAGQSLTYSITGGNTNTAFAINPSNGNLTVNNSSALTIQAYTLTVRVTDNGSPSLWAQASITINVNSGNGNNPPVMLPQTFNKNENGAIDSYVGKVIATDPDPENWLTFSIVGGNTDNAFKIQGNTGRIFVNNADAINYELYQVFYLQVKVIDNLGAFVVETMTINIIDVNEVPIIQNHTFSIIHNAANGTIAGTVIATDPDLNQTLSYSITSGNTNSAFAINSSTGIITVANSTAIVSGSFSLTVRATDNGTPVLWSAATVTIVVTNSTNLTPVITNQSFSVTQNAPNGTLVGTVVATDPNAGQSLTYSITGGNTNIAFAINPSNGNLTVNNSSALTIQAYALTVRVTDNGSPSLWAQATVTITVNSGNGNNPPVMLPQTFNKNENGANGSYVGKVNATDPDPENWLTFSIVGGNTDNAFKIQGNTGRIFVNNADAINYELYQVFYLQVKVIDNLGAFVVETMTINIIDVNEAPVIQNQSFTVNSNAPNGTAFGQVIASDPDQGQTLSYTITAGNTSGIFAINLHTGALTVANATALQNSAVNSFALTITVTDNGSPVLFSNGIATISVLRNRQLEEIMVESLTERLNMELTVYPNPSSDGIFNIKSEQILSENTSLLITDLTGRLVMEESFSGVTIFRIDLSNLPSGIYILNAKNAEKHYNCKLIRQ
jgi:hypothetical protein